MHAGTSYYSTIIKLVRDIYVNVTLLTHTTIHLCAHCPDISLLNF